jgi:hypothetical protein
MRLTTGPLWVLLLLAILTPRQGKAQATETAPAEQQRTFGLVPRVGFELVGGALGGAVGAAPGALVLLSGRGCLDENCSSLRKLGGGLLLLVGGTLGMAQGIRLSGDLLGAHGRFEIAYAFEALLLLNAAATGSDASFQEHKVAYVSSLFAATLVAGIMGYELSNGHPSPAPRQRSRTGGWMRPVMGVSLRGTPTGGLAGTF